MNSVSVEEVRSRLRSYASEEKARVLARFFKTGPGQYGEGDRFLGVVVPDQRRAARSFRDAPFPVLEALLESPWHEERLTALIVMVDQHRRGDPREKERIHRFYMERIDRVNNWDLVDLSAPWLIGPHVDPRRPDLLLRWARSPRLWRRRISIVSTFHFIRQGVPGPALRVAARLLRDRHDLIHKAVGWMLREVGKRCGESCERRFLDAHARSMPRTMLRYAVERFPVRLRQHYMGFR